MVNHSSLTGSFITINDNIELENRVVTRNLFMLLFILEVTKEQNNLNIFSFGSVIFKV